MQFTVDPEAALVRRLIVKLLERTLLTIRVFTMDVEVVQVFCQPMCFTRGHLLPPNVCRQTSG